MKRWKWIILLALCLLLPGCQAEEDAVPVIFPENYSGWLSSSAPGEEYRESQYLIALDRSFSMDGSILERNAAAVALVNSLPEDSKATAFFFSTSFEEVSDMLPLSERREQLTDAIKCRTTANGGTDLGGMMQKALSLFTDLGKDRTIHHVLFVVTDGESDGEGGLSDRRDQKFFQLCEKNRDTVDTYIVYVSDKKTPESLCNGLHTTPITLTDNAEGTDSMDLCRSRLSVWDENEYAKIISIPDAGQLETALLNLRLADADAIYNRTLDHDMTVSFPVFPLHAQEITVALSGGADIGSTITTLRNEEDTDLLQSAAIAPNASLLTLSNEDDLKPGLYTMDISASEPVSLIIACKYSYQVQFGFTGTDEPEKPPANMPSIFHMRLSTPDGKILEDSEYVAVSADIYKNGAYWRTLSSGEAVNLPLTDGKLSLSPVVSYGGVKEVLPGTWEVQPTDLPPALSDGSFLLWTLSRRPEQMSLCDANKVVSDRETLLKNLHFSFQPGGFTGEVAENGRLCLNMEDEIRLDLWNTWPLSVSVEDGAGQKAEAQWSLTVIWFTPVLVLLAALLALFVVLAFLWTRKVKKKRANDRQREIEVQMARIVKDKYIQDIALNNHFIRAGLSWKIEKDGEIYIGGLGLTNPSGEPQRSHSLPQTQSFSLRKEKCPTPFPFGIWKYDEKRGCTVLILKTTSDLQYQVKECKLVFPAGYEYDGGRLVSFGVNQEHPHQEIIVTENGLRAEFYLEYYTDQEPFYQ